MQWDPLSPDEATRLQVAGEDEFIEWLERGSSETFDVDKAWHGIHGVLTGSVGDEGHEFDGVVIGGVEFGPDSGYGPSHLVSADQVAALAERLSALTVDDFRDRIDLAQLSALGIYPDIWDREDEREENISYLVDGYRVVRERFVRAAEAGNAMCISIM